MRIDIWKEKDDHSGGREVWRQMKKVELKSERRKKKYRGLITDRKEGRIYSA